MPGNNTVRATIGVFIGGVLLLLITGCASGSGGDAAPAPGSGSSAERPDQEALARFAEGCDRQLGTFRPAQVDFPLRLPARLDQPTTYVAGLDIRDRPVPPTEYVPGEDRTTRPIAVQCVVAAQLTAVTSGIEVENPADSWRFAEFNEAGVISFSWTVTPRSTAPQELRLELKPAVQSVRIHEFGSAESVKYLTTVDVSASWPKRLGEWVETNFGAIIAVIGAIGTVAAGAAAVFRWSRRGISGVRSHTLARSGPDPRPPDDPGADPPP